MEKMEIKDIMLLQTNNVTFGQYEVTPIQDNILTLISEQLQKYMTTGVINKDLFGMPVVSIICDEAGGPRHKALVLKHIDSLARKLFKFRWNHPNLKKEYNTKGTIIVAYHERPGENQVLISLNPWAIPFLTYYGESVGGTWFKKQIALSLRGDKPKRIYKFLCSQVNNEKGFYDYSIKKFIEDFQLSPSYTNAIIKKRILETAKKEINGICADVWFEYDLITKHKQDNKRKPMADTIRFYIHTTRNAKEIHRHSNKDQKGKDMVLYRWLIATLGSGKKSDDVMTIIMQSDRRDEIIDRVIFWQNQLHEGEKTSDHVKNCIRKMLREDFKIDC